MDNQAILGFGGFFAFLFWAIMLKVFGLISVRYIESKMVKDGCILPPRRAMGSIEINYAIVLLIPKSRISRSMYAYFGIDAQRIARKKDIVLACLLHISSFLMFSFMGIYYFLYVE
ncbi:hypothetical protein AKG98_4206 [Moritella sp. JT01]|uniref:hypothetical protein n=1 Tax=Moritella sp. JT01 TaxID=756698 RepID=UPI0007969A4A|nr:hypothetical protein [Moritella sp. JT01]KXO13006.1 hypothetical protein AKG98_4206 [Moritella sp. JT01]